MNSVKTPLPIGLVTSEERDIIRQLYQRKTALIELSKSLASLSAMELESSPLYEKLIKDLGTVTIDFQAWWDRMSAKYQWKNVPGGQWNINFDTCEITLQS